jgi:thiol-disulfide isomerase/thioredoxin
MNLQSTTLLFLICIWQALSLQSRSFTTRRRRQLTSLSSSRAVDPPAPSFRDRMRQQLNNQGPNKSKGAARKNALVKEARTLEEFKTIVVDEANGKLVVVWFYAPWCRACRATSPGFASLAKHHPETKFVKVPVLEDNANLHQGLNVPSVPYLHLYHPTSGLMEEQKLVRKNLPGLHKMLQDYVEGSCSLERSGDWSSESPYVPAPKAI